MGQIASDGCSNLAYFSRMSPITEPLLQNPTQSQQKPNDLSEYNKSLTYLSIIIGDGDNVGMVQSTRRDWMQERVSKCTAFMGEKESETSSMDNCFPLVWSLSPQLTHIAPEWSQW
jgi:hypothetical protein